MALGLKILATQMVPIDFDLNAVEGVPQNSDEHAEERVSSR